MLIVKDVVKKFYIGEPNELTILRGVNLTIQEGEFVAIVGASGSGKSTLMNIIGALDTPTEGDFSIDGVSTSAMTENELSELRNQKIGFVFQTFNLIPRSTALTNVALPMFYFGTPKRKRMERATELLAMVGMESRMHHRPNELSGGQKQRVAIARALCNNPKIILADEPTGALDSETGDMVMDLFLRIHREEKKTIVFITHNNELAEMTERVVTIKDGLIIEDRQAQRGGE